VFVIIIGMIQISLGLLASILFSLLLLRPLLLFTHIVLQTGLLFNYYFILWSLAIFSFFSVISGVFLVYGARESQGRA
ncbi:MAG: hypothetical protein ACE5J7_05510, partial [Candidatus Aenigmatarchaeota archaeon]